MKNFTFGRGYDKKKYFWTPEDGERRVFIIDVGNLPDVDMDEYIRNIAERFITPLNNTDPIDYTIPIHPPLGIDEDIFLPSPATDRLRQQALGGGVFVDYPSKLIYHSGFKFGRKKIRY